MLAELEPKWHSYPPCHEAFWRMRKDRSVDFMGMPLLLLQGLSRLGSFNTDQPSDQYTLSLTYLANVLQ